MVEEIRCQISDGNTDVFIFLGAGVSFGCRAWTRVVRVPAPPDDGGRFPSWPLLINRMHARVASLPEFKDHGSDIERFFTEQSPIDCAELFREKVGKANYYAFLREQFVTKQSDARLLTRSHHALTRLPVKTVFTTNLDQLIELSFRSSGQDVRISSTPSEFISNRRERDLVHLVKLNGSNRSARNYYPMPYGLCQGPERAHGDVPLT